MQLSVLRLKKTIQKLTIIVGVIRRKLKQGANRYHHPH